MKKIGFLMIALIMLTFSVQAQTEISGANWDTQEEYKAAKGTIIRYIKRLENNPLEDLGSRSITNYLLSWIAGSNEVAIKLDDFYFTKILNDQKYKYGDFLAYGLIFGQVVHLLEYPNDIDRNNAYRRGVYYAINVYEKLKAKDASTKCETLELFIKLKENGTLNSFIKLEEENR